MLDFVLFSMSVLIFICFLTWCFYPVLKKRENKVTSLFRLGVGILLVSANWFPLLVAPILVPVSNISQSASEYLYATILFPHTLPTYIRNLRNNRNVDATVVELLYPISISGNEYEARVTIACTKREVVRTDKGSRVFVASNVITTAGREMLAHVDGALITANHGRHVCDRIGSRLPTTPHKISNLTLISPIYVIRGQAEYTKIYSLNYRHMQELVRVDNITIGQPIIRHATHIPSSEVFNSQALWPIETRKERYITPRAISAFDELTMQAKSCVQNIYTARVRNFRKENQIEIVVRRHFKGRRKRLRGIKMQTYCSSELANITLPVATQRLSPIRKPKD